MLEGHFDATRYTRDFERYRMYEGHLTRLDVRGAFDATRCARDIFPRLFVRRTLDLTLYARDIFLRLVVRGTFGRYPCTRDTWRDSVCVGHFSAARCTGTCDRCSIYEWHFDATKYRRDVLTRLNIGGTFWRDSVYEEIWMPRPTLISMNEISAPDCCSVCWPTLIINHCIALLLLKISRHSAMYDRCVA